jgi:hypothetical protein
MAMQIYCASLLTERRVSSNAPTAFTPAGGYGDTTLGRYERELPKPILGDDEVLDDGVPDLRGTWKVAELLVNGVAAPSDHSLWAHVERIEQSGNRVIVVGGGVIHDFSSCDGTLENGLHDVMAIDFSTPLQVAATYEDGALVMRPLGMPVEVKRWRDGEQLVWEYSIAFIARLNRIN